MAKIGQAQDEAMEAILASIRSMMSEEEAPLPVPDVPRPPAQLPPNVSKLFSERPPSPRAETAADDAETDVRRAGAGIEDTLERRSQDPDLAVERAMTRAMEQARAEVERTGRGRFEERQREEPRRASATRPEPEIAPPDRAGRTEPHDTAIHQIEARQNRPSSPPLLSPAAGAAVAGAFDELAYSMLSGGGRTIDDLVEDLLRPMLRDWLDDNLPPLVERLVREEIERVSRGRR